MQAHRIGALLLTVAIGLTACGNGDGDLVESTKASDPEQPASAPGESIAVKTADSPLGEILVGPDGLTLYGFTNDSNGQSNCSGTCADAWPPLLVDEGWTVGPGLDSAVFNTITRDDGSRQLVAGQWPLYYFSGDTAPGDLNGQGSGGVWFVVSSTDVTLIQDPVPPGGDDAGADASAGQVTVQVSETALGEVLTDAEGHTLYGFTQDSDGVPTCAGDCATAWPALLVDGEPIIGEGLDPATFSTVDGAEEGTQLKAGNWPLYRFSGDAAPGDVNGQGSGGVWFAVRADGTLVDA
jgi:predicted lipoprotein with Yx(FWY)xxD motif